MEKGRIKKKGDIFFSPERALYNSPGQRQGNALGKYQKEF